ncbi:MAG TPA: glycosyltransferase family 4 protein [Gemmatimonadales bacterium]|nr:glycosyltransferase family 4 protein [Gemmatimonadales bacterium]
MAPRVELQLGFVGGLDWAPNESGLRWFVEEALPTIVAAIPEATLAVLARGAWKRAWIASNPRIRVMPEGTHAVSIFASSRVTIAPLLHGGGVRVKILESLAAGCPVVATSIGGEGLELAGLTKVDGAASFAQACIRHLREAPSRDTRERLYREVATKHAAESVARNLMEYWVSVDARHFPK